MGLYIWIFCGASRHEYAALVQNELQIPPKKWDTLLHRDQKGLHTNREKELKMLFISHDQKHPFFLSKKTCGLGSTSPLPDLLHLGRGKFVDSENIILLGADVDGEVLLLRP